MRNRNIDQQPVNNWGEERRSHEKNNGLVRRETWLFEWNALMRHYARAEPIPQCLLIPDTPVNV